MSTEENNLFFERNELFYQSRYKKKKGCQKMRFLTEKLAESNKVVSFNPKYIVSLNLVDLKGGFVVDEIHIRFLNNEELIFDNGRALYDKIIKFKY